jgi:hypothetical protein
MIDADAILREMMAGLDDQNVFSDDQINYLQRFADQIDDLIDAKLENFKDQEL